MMYKMIPSNSKQICSWHIKKALTNECMAVWQYVNSPTWIHKGIVIYHFTANMLITDINMPYIVSPPENLILSQFGYIFCVVA